MDELQRFRGAACNARGFSIGTALFAPERRVDAQIAFGRLVLVGIPDRPVRPLRAELDAPLAADALGLIDNADIAVFGVDMSSAGRTILDAKR